MPGFSLKGMLLAVAYVAIAAASCSQQHKLWDQALWILTAVLALHAVLGGLLLRGMARATAIGYAVFAMAFAFTLWQNPAVSPANFLGYSLGLEFPVTSELSNTLRRRSRSLAFELSVAENAANNEYRRRISEQADAAERMVERYASLAAITQSINAIGVTAAGVLGALLAGRLWTSRVRQEAADPVRRGHDAASSGPYR